MILKDLVVDSSIMWVLYSCWEADYNHPCSVSIIYWARLTYNIPFSLLLLFKNTPHNSLPSLKSLILPTTVITFASDGGPKVLKIKQDSSKKGDTEVLLTSVYRKKLAETINEITYLASSCNRVFTSQMGLVAVIAVKPKQIRLKWTLVRINTLLTLRVIKLYKSMLKNMSISI